YIYILFIGIAACAISIASPFLISVLGGSKYNGAEKVLPFMLFSAIPISLINFSSLGMIYAKRSFLNTITLTIGFTIVLILNFLLTPAYLQYGAVNASIIGHCCIAAAGYYFSRRYYKIPFRFEKDIPVFIFLLFFAIVSVNFYFSANIYLDISFKIIILILLSLLIFTFLFKNEYRKVLSIIRNMRMKISA
ncbi:MAG TPA: polysaccharide biosynthesis C-terminal domain-containing protein, partial [Chitinophagaceae bacterium]|nr:polysaccharide biosynthesis C-terminal domain-containing protein [Chitinophagaceae bacterium]